MSTHAKRSPSGAAGWLACAGWTSDDKGSKYANEGTAAHELAAMCLLSGTFDRPTEPREHLGLKIAVGGNIFTVDDEMALAVGDYVSYVRDVVKGTGGELLVEQKLGIEGITGEPDAKGTSDAVILAPGELIIADLKYGRGVAVEADGNPQLQIYALAAVDEFSLAHDFTTVRMVIHQPRLGAVSEWVQTVEQLEEFRAQVGKQIAIHEANPDARTPGTKQCQWCSQKATCSALAKHVADVVGADFDVIDPPGNLTELDAKLVPSVDNETLATKLKAADLIEAWLKAVRAEVESRLLAGQAVPGFKLVQGKKGNRAWSDPEAAEKLLKDTFRLKTEEMYDLSLISPTTAEKLAPRFDKSGKEIPPKDGQPKPRLGPRQWAKAKALITQADGKPSVAPETDKRPALVMSAVADDFTDVTETSCDLA